METIRNNSTGATAIHWIASIICLIAILFISMFALDAFDPALTFIQQLKSFMMHLIPSFVLLSLYIFTLKKELTGGLIFLLIGLALSPFIYTHNFNLNHSVGTSLGIVAMINLPFIIVGVLFIVSYYLHRRKRSIKKIQEEKRNKNKTPVPKNEG
ncbi:MAG: hypothetical protein IPO83_07210 [Chitinophagaceae bacterium]|nr:hypothetical protein [Chitinophagaceae bacterium]